MEYYDTMRAPKGISASCANLKHCTPNGMPKMVTHQASPTMHEIKVSSQPKMSIHNTFKIKLVVQFSKITFLPNGQITNEVNLKH